MSLFSDAFDKINDIRDRFASVAMLHEDLDLLRSMLSIYERENEKLAAENKKLEASFEQAKHRIGKLEKQLDELKKTQSALNPNALCCACCGSVNIERTGSTPNIAFSALGLQDAVYTCRDCRGTTQKMIPPGGKL